MSKQKYITIGAISYVLLFLGLGLLYSVDKNIMIAIIVLYVSHTLAKYINVEEIQ